MKGDHYPLWIFALAAMLLAWTVVRADSVIDLKAVDVTYKQYTSPGADELLYPRTHTSSLNLSLDMDVYDIFYVRATVMSESDETQFRAIGLNYHLGVHLDRHMEVEYEHYSKHLLDANWYLPGFPRYDSLNVVIHLIPVRN